MTTEHPNIHAAPGKSFGGCLRRLHLDYHNPAGIADLGVDFNGREFAMTIAEAGFDSVTVCAQDAHGHCYFPTEAGVRHPSLRGDLLGEMVRACKEAGLVVGVYINTGASDYAPRQYRQVRRDGAPRDFVEQAGYRMLCLNSDYIEERILPLSVEIVQRYPMDAVWYDLLFFHDEGCHCDRCLAAMKEAGLAPDSPLDMRRHMRRSIGKFVDKAHQCVRHLNPRVEVAFNGISIHEAPEGLEQSACVDIEALATGGWGYFYYPAKARYLRTLGKPVVGMTACFHEAWQDFGTIKSQALLEMECHTIVATTQALSIGDQLPPRGVLEQPKYNRMAEVLQPLAKLDDWLQGARPMVEAAIVLDPLAQGQFPGAAWAGACKLLMEAKVQFDTVDRGADWGQYPLLILPDDSYQDAAFRDKLASRLEQGLAVLATGDALASLPSDVVRPGRQCFSGPGYARVHRGWGCDVPDMAHAMRGPLVPITCGSAVKVLATRVRPYEVRGNTACYNVDTDDPMAIEHGRLIYLAANLFQAYWRYGYGMHRQLLAAAVRRLLLEPLVKSRLPLAFEQAVLKQKEKIICYVIPYAPVRGEHVEQIEEWPQFSGLEVGVRGTFNRACLAPNRTNLNIRHEEKYTIALLPPCRGPQVVVFE